MAVAIFPNLPVKDLDASKNFFQKLGFELNAGFTDENAACVVVDDNISIMLLHEPFFSTFTTKTIADTSTSVEMLLALAVESRDRVDELADAASGAGAVPAGEPSDMGFMYSRSFYDLDGHHWELLHMDLDAMPKE